MLHHSRSGPARAHRKRQELGEPLTTSEKTVQLVNFAFIQIQPKRFPNTHTHESTTFPMINNDLSQPSWRPCISQKTTQEKCRTRACIKKKKKDTEGELIHHSGSTSSLHYSPTPYFSFLVGIQRVILTPGYKLSAWNGFHRSRNIHSFPPGLSVLLSALLVCWEAASRRHFPSLTV